MTTRNETVDDRPGERDGMDLVPGSGTALGSLVGRTVRLDGLDVGYVSDVVLNPGLTQVVGLDVTQVATVRFIPWMLFREEGDDLELITAEALRERTTIGLILQHGVRLSRVSQTPAATVGPSGELEHPRRRERRRPPPHACSHDEGPPNGGPSSCSGSGTGSAQERRCASSYSRYPAPPGP